MINSFQDRASEEWVGFENYSDLLSSSAFQKTLVNTLLWIIIVPAVTVVVGLAVAVLADRLKPGAEKVAKTVIFLPMAIAWSRPGQSGASSTTPRQRGSRRSAC